MKLKTAYILLMVLVSFGIISCKNNSDSEDKISDSSEADTQIMPGNTMGKTDAIIKNKNEVNADWLLVPGISAGQTQLNENADNLFQRFGAADGGDAAMQKAVAVWYAQHDSTSYSTAVYTARNTDSPTIAKVLQIRVTSPVFKTTNGIHTTSSLPDIQNEFQVEKTETYQDAGNSYSVYDSKKGIAFEINSDDKCVAIIIHKAGVTGEGTYLKFRTTNKFIDQ